MAYLRHISGFFAFPPKPLVGVRFSHPLLKKLRIIRYLCGFSEFAFFCGSQKLYKELYSYIK